MLFPVTPVSLRSSALLLWESIPQAGDAQGSGRDTWAGAGRASTGSSAPVGDAGLEPAQCL